jgi:hypothetical protein
VVCPMILGVFGVLRGERLLDGVARLDSHPVRLRGVRAGAGFAGAPRDEEHRDEGERRV